MQSWLRNWIVDLGWIGKKDEDAEVSEKEEDEEAEPHGKLCKRRHTKAKKSHRQPNKKAREGRTS